MIISISPVFGNDRKQMETESQKRKNAYGKAKKQLFKMRKNL
jgi:hypothetical protein